MAHIRPVFFFPFLAPMVSVRPWSTYLSVLCKLFHRCYVLLPFFFLLTRSLSRVCLCMTLHFSLSLSNRTTLMGVHKTCGLQEIALLCSRRRGALITLGRKISDQRLFHCIFIEVPTKVVPTYLPKRHTDLLLRGTAPVITIFKIIPP